MSASLFAFCCVLGFGFAASAAVPEAAQYRIAHRFQVPGDEGWDCLAADSATQHLFVSHGNCVQVIDENSGHLIGTIANLGHVHSIALAPALGKGFITDGKDSQAVVIDLHSLQILAKVKTTGANPDLAVFDEYSGRVFVCNGKSANATVIDAKTDRVVGTIPLHGKPEFAVSNGLGRVFVNLEDQSKLAVIDVTTLQVIHTWPIAPGQSPSGLALDRKHHRLFLGCDNRMMVVLGAQSGKVVATLPIGEHVDGVDFDPVLQRAYSSNGDGTLTVVQEVSPDSFFVRENALTQKGARTSTVDLKTHHLFLPTADFGATPPPTAEHPHPHPAIVPGTFIVLDVAPAE